MSKKLLSLVLALVMVLGTFGTAFAASFPDTVETVYDGAVDRLSLLEILEGYPDGTFKPENQITRAEFAAVAVRAKGLEDAANAAKGLATGFTDVAPAPAHWAAGYVGTAARLGIVNGVGGGLFAPEAPVKYEEAITMIVRALGYEAAAQTKGGYPYGYLIVANEVGLLDEVKGVQGTSATRGTVAQITDNALEIPMMIQVGFGADAKWVVSGSREHGDNAKEQYLLDSLGFEAVEGRVISVNTKTDKIVVDPTDEDLKNVTLEVAEGFDFYAVEGLEAKFWSKDDVVVVYAVQEEAKFDAVEVDGDELTLVVEDENYDVVKKAILTLDGEEVEQDEFVADYAKVVLNDDDEIIWAQGYSFDGFILVEEVKDEVAYSFDDYDELDLEDFTVVKDGKTVGIDGIEEEDILFYNVDEEFAVVYNKGTEGELDRVYTDATFRFEGSAYAHSAVSVPLYFDEGKIGELDANILDEFLDDEATIEVFVDFAGDVVLVKGEVSSIGNSSYVALTGDVVVFSGRKGLMIALDVRNGANEKVSYDLLIDDLGDDIDLTNITSTKLQGLVKADDVVLKISVDKDGDVTAIELPESVELDKDLKIDDSNAKGTDGYSYKVQSNTIVFHDSNKKATTLGSAKDVFSEVEAGATIFFEKGRVVAVIGETDADTDTKDVTGLVTGVKELTSGKLQFTVKVLGETQRLVTESKTLKVSDYANYKDTVRTFEVGETSGEIKDFGTVNSRPITVSSVSGRIITPTTGNAVELNTKAVIYDAADGFDTLNIRDLKKDMAATVYFQGSSNRFVDYVVVGSQTTDTVTATGVVTYIDATKLYVDNTEVYFTAANTILRDKDNKVLLTGADLTTKLDQGDQVDVKATGTVANEVKILKTVEEFAVAKAAARFAQTNPKFTAGAIAVNNATTLATAKAAVASITAPALTVAEVALLDATTTPTAAAYTTAENNLATTKANIATYEGGLGAQAAVDAEAAKVPAEIILTGSTAINASNTEAAIKAIVDLNKVVVSGVTTTGATLTAKGRTETATLTFTVTNEDTIAAAAAAAADQAMVEAELAEVPAALVLAAGSTADVATVTAAVEALVDLNKVDVTVTDNGDADAATFLVTIDSKVAAGTDNKVINVTVAL